MLMNLLGEFDKGLDEVVECVQVLTASGREKDGRREDIE